LTLTLAVEAGMFLARFDAPWRAPADIIYDIVGLAIAVVILIRVTVTIARSNACSDVGIVQ
jgi:hypothetical protein